jgi:hypothetical protein
LAIETVRPRTAPSDRTNGDPAQRSLSSPEAWQRRRGLDEKPCAALHGCRLRRWIRSGTAWLTDGAGAARGVVARGRHAKPFRDPTVLLLILAVRLFPLGIPL